jgi:hypothetical protein
MTTGILYMKKQITKLLLLLFLLPVLAFAQKDTPQRDAPQPPDEGSRIFTGGSFALQFGTYTLVQISPIVGYKLTERFMPGISITYLYSKYNDPSGLYPSYSTNMYGGSVFGRYFVTQNLFAHLELEVLNMDVPNATSSYYYTGFHRQNVSSLFVGGGYREAMGGRSSINIMLLYDVIQDLYSPYSNPIIRIGFGFGI